jgi:hypothetical protein
MRTHTEKFNQNKLAYLIENRSDFPINRPTSDDNYDSYFMAEKYLKKSTNGTINVSYDYANGKTSGRMFAKESLSMQSIAREIRHTISKEYYHDTYNF